MSVLPYEIVISDHGDMLVRVIGQDDLFSEALVQYGYECDGASIPRWLWPLCGDPFVEPRIRAAIVHDWMYESVAVTRKVADETYYRNLVRLGVPRWKAAVEYAFVRAFGGRHWGC